MPNAIIETLAVSAVVSVKQNLDASGSSENDQVDGGAAVLVFDVQLDMTTITANADPAAAFLVAQRANGIPWIDDTYPDDDWLWCVDKTCRRRGGDLFEVTCRYKSVEDPLAADPVVDIGFVGSEEPIDRDINGDPILNSADVTFDPPVTSNFDDMLLSITRNQSAFNLTQALNYKGTLNDASFYGFAAGKCKISDIKGTMFKSAGRYYYSVTYEFQFRWDGWLKRRLDEGMRRIVSSTPGSPLETEVIPDKNGEPLTEPHMLDGSGALLNSDATPVYLEFDIYRSTDFSVLDIEYANLFLTY